MITFRVHGTPKPGGSKKAFVHPHAKNKAGKPMVIVMDACKGNKEWRDAVAAAAREAYEGPLLGSPLVFSVEFYLPRPKSHYGTGKKSDVLKLSAPKYHTKSPDLTKLLRSTEDALTGVVWRDDAQVVETLVGKRYDKITGASITISELSRGEAP